jgi:hypothetical protein
LKRERDEKRKRLVKQKSSDYTSSLTLDILTNNFQWPKVLLILWSDPICVLVGGHRCQYFIPFFEKESLRNDGNVSGQWNLVPRHYLISKT